MNLIKHFVLSLFLRQLLGIHIKKQIIYKIVLCLYELFRFHIQDKSLYTVLQY
jgi:hypothetical protein